MSKEIAVMAKIPFSIDYKPQIESGEYKVETRDGRTVRIICWDAKGPSPIIGLFMADNGGEATTQNYPNGRWSEYESYESDYDLFIVTPEEELTEFEKALADVVGYAISQSVVEPSYETYKFAKDWSERLLDAAKKELCKGCAANLEGYARGKLDILYEMSRMYKHEGPTAFWPHCHYGGECTNPFRDCMNCPRGATTVGINTTTGTSTTKVEGKK